MIGKLTSPSTKRSPVKNQGLTPHLMTPHLNKKNKLLLAIITIAVIFALVPFADRLGVMEYRDRVVGRIADKLFIVADSIGISPMWFLLAFSSCHLYSDRRKFLVSRRKFSFKEGVSDVDKVLVVGEALSIPVFLYCALVWKF